MNNNFRIVDGRGNVYDENSWEFNFLYEYMGTDPRNPKSWDDFWPKYGPHQVMEENTTVAGEVNVNVLPTENTTVKIVSVDGTVYREPALEFAFLLERGLDPHDPKSWDKFWPQFAPHRLVESETSDDAVVTDDIDPDHYDKNGFKCRDVQREAFDTYDEHCEITALKYLWRLGDKDDPFEDAIKAQDYIRFAIEAREGELEVKMEEVYDKILAPMTREQKIGFLRGMAMYAIIDAWGPEETLKFVEMLVYIMATEE